MFAVDFKKISAYGTGLCLTCAGVAFVLRAGWGVDAWNGVFAGLERLTPLSLGAWSMIIQGMFWLIAAALNRKADWLCVLPIVMKGWLLDLAKAAVFALPVSGSPWARCLLFLGGYALVGLGTGVYVETGYPRMPIDGLMLALADCFAWDVKRSRLLIEGTGFAALLLVRGPLGVGTVIITFTIGYGVSASRKWAQKIIFKRNSE